MNNYLITLIVSSLSFASIGKDKGSSHNPQSG